MTTTLEHRQVGYVWMWVITVIDEVGRVIAWAMNVDFMDAVNAIHESVDVEL